MARGYSNLPPSGTVVFSMQQMDAFLQSLFLLYLKGLPE